MTSSSGDNSPHQPFQEESLFSWADRRSFENMFLSLLLSCRCARYSTRDLKWIFRRCNAVHLKPGESIVEKHSD